MTATTVTRQRQPGFAPSRRGCRQGDRSRALRLRVRRRRGGVRVAGDSRRSPTAGSARSTTMRSWATTACSRCCGHGNAPRLHEPDPFLAVLQTPEVAFRGQVVALVVALTQEAAREAAARLPVEYDVLPHDTVLTPDHAVDLRARRGQPRPRHRLGDRRPGPGVRRERRPGRRDVHDTGGAQQPDGAARHDGDLGRRHASRSRTPTRAGRPCARRWPRCSGCGRRTCGW